LPHSFILRAACAADTPSQLLTLAPGKRFPKALPLHMQPAGGLAVRAAKV
jgi:hypothetical protein